MVRTERAALYESLENIYIFLIIKRPVALKQAEIEEMRASCKRTNCL